MASAVNELHHNDYRQIEIPKTVKDGIEAMSLSSENIKLLAEHSIDMLLQSENGTKQAESKCNMSKNSLRFIGVVRYVLYLVYLGYYFQ